MGDAHLCLGGIKVAISRPFFKLREPRPALAAAGNASPSGAEAEPAAAVQLALQARPAVEEGRLQRRVEPW